MPVMLVGLMTVFGLAGSLLPLSVKEVMLALSLVIKSGILFCLPFVIFSLLFKTMTSLSGKATAVISLILLMVCVSNFTTTFLSHYVGQAIYHLNFSILQPDAANALAPAFDATFPGWISNSKAMLAGIVLGVIGGHFAKRQAEYIAEHLARISQGILTVFHWLLPVFIAGFFVKLQHDGVMALVLRDYAPIFLIVALTQLAYIVLLYFVLNAGQVRRAGQAMKHLLPAAMTGFSTMSSAAAMPLTLKGVASNAEDPDLAQAVVPCTVNVHLMGDCIAIPLFAYALMKSFGIPEPSLVLWLVFTVYFVAAKFSVAAVPGGGILVMLPILEAHLGFTPDMLSLITALYVLFDPIITCANIMGNGGFAKLCEKSIRMMTSITPTAGKLPVI